MSKLPAILIICVIFFGFTLPALLAFRKRLADPADDYRDCIANAELPSPLKREG